MTVGLYIQELIRRTDPARPRLGPTRVRRARRGRLGRAHERSFCEAVLHSVARIEAAGNVATVLALLAVAFALVTFN